MLANARWTSGRLMNRVSRTVWPRLGVVAAAWAMVGTGDALGVTHLQAGDEAPALSLMTAGGERVEVPGEAEVVVVLFGDSSHASVRPAAEQIAGFVGDPRLVDVDLRWVVILTSGSEPEAVLGGVDEEALTNRPTVVLDEDRRAFSAYEVVAVPAIVVMDGDGEVVWAHAGPLPHGSREPLEALLAASGEIERGEVEEEAKGDEEPTATRRAERLARMAEQLSRRGMVEAAEGAYERALAIAPNDEMVLLGYGGLLNGAGRGEEAEGHFRRVLGSDPGSVRAKLGLAHALLAREDARVEEAAALVGDVLREDPENARGHYVEGLVHESRGESERAARSFKKAAEILLRSEIAGESG